MDSNNWWIFFVMAFVAGVIAFARGQRTPQDSWWLLVFLCAGVGAGLALAGV